MENKSKKADLKARLLRDEGDVRKVDKSVTSGCSVAKLNNDCGRGDTAPKVGVEKIKICEKVADVLPKNSERIPSVQTWQPKKSDRRQRDESLRKDPLTKIAEMKKIREHYTFRNKFPCIKRVNDECIKKSCENVVGENDREPKPSEEVTNASPKDVSSPKVPMKSVLSQKESNRECSDQTELKRRTPPKQPIRRPIIKTITSISDKTKVYKAVNFVDKKVPTPLQVNIPTEKTSKERAIPVISKVSIKERRKRKKKRSFRSPAVSPDVTVKIRSPPTEVAKWASVDNHKKLYYEAWVDTTLAAISKKAKDEKFDKQKFMQTFQKALAERPISPEIDYKMLLDERYTGKIKVHKG